MKTFLLEPIYKSTYSQEDLRATASIFSGSEEERGTSSYQKRHVRENNCQLKMNIKNILDINKKVLDIRFLASLTSNNIFQYLINTTCLTSCRTT